MLNLPSALVSLLMRVHVFGTSTLPATPVSPSRKPLQTPDGVVILGFGLEADQHAEELCLEVRQLGFVSRLYIL